VPTVTREQLRENVLNRLDRNDVLYRHEEIHTAIDDAIRALNLFTGFIQQTTTHAAFTTAGTHVYDVPSASNYLFITKVEFAGRVLDKTSLHGLSNAYPEWLRETTATTGIPVSRWCPIGMKKFAIHPADAVGSQAIRLGGVVDFQGLSADNSTITFPNEFSDMIEDLAAHYLPIKEGGLIFSQGSLLYTQFLSKMKELKRYQTFKAPAYWVESDTKVA
jgi:hypothetical protein